MAPGFAGLLALLALPTLLPFRPTMKEVHEIAKLPLSGRSYDETVAVNFCGDADVMRT